MRKHILMLLIFIILTAVITFPLIFNLTTHIPGFFSTDEPQAGIWDFWRINHSFKNGLNLISTDLISYPFGFKFYTSGFVTYIWQGLNHFLAITTTPVLTWNIQIILNFILTALFGYLLAVFLTKSKIAGLLTGISFSFCPQHFANSWQHLGICYFQWIPLVLLAAIFLRKRENKKGIISLAAAIILLFSFDFSIMYLGMFSLAAFIFYTICFNWREKLFKNRTLLKADLRFFKNIVIAGVIAFIILLPQLLPLIRNYFNPPDIGLGASGFNPFHRPFEDLFSQSAKPLSYILPATFHPVFGKFTTMFVGSHLWGGSFTMHQLYLGWVPLILAIYAIRKWREQRRLRGQSSLGAVPQQDFYIGFFIFLALIAWLFSQPPWWQMGNMRIYMPSFFMYKILPMYRAYCRFGIIAILAVSVLAGYGLKFVLDKFKNRWVKGIISVLCCGLVLFEFWNWPPYKVIDVSKAPDAYYWLYEQEGDFAIAEYPLDAEGPNEIYKFYQIFHQKPIINSTSPGTYANKVAQTITDLSEYKTASILKWMGVKYVVVHKEGYEATGLVDKMKELDRIPRNRGLRLIKQFPAQDCPEDSYSAVCMQKAGPIDVYEVIARPKEPVVE
jgi:hypothetical protein